MKFEGLSIDLKMNNLDLSGNITEFKTSVTRCGNFRHFYDNCGNLKFVVIITVILIF